MKTHLDFVFDHEVNRPDSVWLVQPMGDGTVRELTWRQALDEARRMAAYLRGLDLPRSSQIAIFAKNNAWWLLSDLAIWMAGHVSVPLYATLSADTIRQVLEHSESRVIFIGKLDGFEAMEPGIPDRVRRIAMPFAAAGCGTPWAEIIASTEPLPGRPTRDPDDLATIVYTSGSTGVPKGVMHSFRTMAAALIFVDRLEQGEQDRVLSYLPLAHVYERAVIETCSMKSAMRVFFAESLATFIDDLRRARPTLFVSVPRLWLKFQQAVFEKLPPAMLDKMLADPATRDPVRKKVLDSLGLGEVRHAATGSAPIPDALLAWYRDLGLDLLEGYAMTENFCVSHATRPDEWRAGYVGRPADGVEQQITSAGEVLVKSPGTMLGYYKAKDLTDEVLGPDGFLHTGDRGIVDEIGRLKITGRVKELFKTSKGKYVAPAPIENLILQHAAVEQALVSGSAMPQPFGLVVLSEAMRGRFADPAVRETVTRELSEHLLKVNASLDPHEHLEKLVIVGEPWTIENGMLTPTMKVKRTVIEDHYAPRVEHWYATPGNVVVSAGKPVALGYSGSMTTWPHLVAVALVATACGGGKDPQINGLADQVATVGAELVVEIDGSDPDGGRLTYGVKADISLQGNAMITQTPAGLGVFRWTPLAEDIGVHAFDFTVSDGSNTTTVSISIEVRSAVGAVPLFRQPLGAGTVVNIAQQPCVMLDIIVEDQDSAEITIAEEAPLITGSILTILDGTTASWMWCPTPQQAAAQDRYTLVLSADDGENPKTTKNFVIVLRSPAGATLVINEIDYDQAGTDVAEYIEIYNPSASPISLAGIQLVLVTGSSSTPYDTIDLSPAGSLAGDRYLVIAGSAVAVPASAQKLDPVWSQDQIQNGAPDGLALIDSVTHTVLDALSYEGSITDATFVDFPAAVSLVEGTPLDPTVADANTGIRTLCRNPNGTDTNNAATDWTACTSLSVGTANTP